MIIDKPGKVTDRILLLGRRESCVYVLNGGAEYALIGGGMVHIVPDIVKQSPKFSEIGFPVDNAIGNHTEFAIVGQLTFVVIAGFVTLEILFPYLEL